MLDIKFIEINDAYITLTNPAIKTMHDKAFNEGNIADLPSDYFITKHEQDPMRNKAKIIKATLKALLEKSLEPYSVKAYGKKSPSSRFADESSTAPNDDFLHDIKASFIKPVL